MAQSYLFDELFTQPADFDCTAQQDDWNYRFHKILAVEDDLRKYTLMNALNRDFIAAASAYAKTIISEYFLPDSLKSIRVQQIGGQAGGKKFLWRGILFKLAYSNQGPYTGNDEAAAKAMGHELKGGNSYFRCAVPDLRVALQALIDYKGFRMHAQSYLPLDGSTLQVGTSDACREVHASSEELLVMMKQAAAELNLSPHVIKGKTLYAGCDVEGHVGKDGNYYIIDLSRTFPPESPRDTPHLFSRPDAHVLGTVVAVSLPAAVLVDSAGQVDVDEIKAVDASSENSQRVSVRARVYSKNNDGTYDVRLESDECSGQVVLEEYRRLGMPLESQDYAMPPYNAYIRRVPSSDIISSADSGLSIYWRLLRPEYVKHRGKRILNSLRSIQAKRIRAAGTVIVDCIDDLHDGDNNHTCEAYVDLTDATAIEHRSVPALPLPTALGMSDGYNEAGLLIQSVKSSCPPDRASIHRSFSSPIQHSREGGDGYSDPSCMLRCVLPLARHRSTSATSREAEFRPSSEMVELTQDVPDAEGENDGEEFDLEDLPLPTRLRQTTSDALYENMPLPDQLEIVNQPSQNSVTHVGDIPLCSPEMQLQVNSWTMEKPSRTLVDADELLTRFMNITGTAYSSADCCALPLSPDALSNFSKSDPDCDQRNREVQDATSLLIQCIVPALSVDLLENGHPKERQGLSITEYMHQHGVNIRHMGLLRHCIRTQLAILEGDENVRVGAILHIDVLVQVSSELLQECIGRALKNMLRDLMRMWMYSQRMASEDDMIQVVVRFLNLVTGYHPKAGHFWREMLIPGVITRFGEVSLSIDELCLTGDDSELPALFMKFCSHSELTDLVRNLCHRTGVCLSPESVRQFHDGPAKFFEFAASDVVDILPVVKHMHQVDLAEGLMLSLRGQEKENEESRPGVIMRLMSLAVDKLHAALKAVPDDDRTINGLADAYQTLAFAEWQHGKRCEPDKESSSAFKLFRSLLSDDSHSRCLHTGFSYKDDILGVCLELKHFHEKTNSQDEEPHFRIEIVQVCLEVLSLSWFRQHCIHTSTSTLDGKKQSRRRRFFPLIVNQEHGDMVKELLCEEIVRADQLPDNQYSHSLDPLLPDEDPFDTRGTYRIQSCLRSRLPQFSSGIALRVISAVMNGMVVEFASQADYHNEGKLSDSAVVGFSRFHHMLLYLAIKFPSIREEADNTVEAFVSSRIRRTKLITKDMGRLLVYLLLSKRMWDREFREAFLEETLSRQVNWITKDHLNPELLVLETDPVCVYRLVTTFQASVQSLRIVMFQVYFLHRIARKRTRFSASDEMDCVGGMRRDDLIFDLYNASLGRPTAAMRNDFRRQMEEIKSVRNYHEFLDRIGCDYTPAEMTVFLRNGVRGCCAKRYGGMKVTDIIGNTTQEELGESNHCAAGDSGHGWADVIASATPENMCRWRREAKGKWLVRKKVLKELMRGSPRKEQKKPRSARAQCGGVFRPGQEICRGNGCNSSERGHSGQGCSSPRNSGRYARRGDPGRRGAPLWEVSRAELDQNWRSRK